MEEQRGSLPPEEKTRRLEQALQDVIRACQNPTPTQAQYWNSERHRLLALTLRPNVVTRKRERTILERSVHAIASHARDAYALIEQLHAFGLSGDGPDHARGQTAPHGATHDEGRAGVGARQAPADH